MHVRHINLGLALATLLAATPVAAQVYVPADKKLASSSGESLVDTRGFHIGIGLNGSSIRADNVDAETESGGGLHLRVGYGFTPRLTLFAGGAGASMNDGDYALGQVDVGLRGSFPGASRLVPSIEGALTSRAMVIKAEDIGTTDDMYITGLGFTGGAALDYYVSRAVSFGLGLAYTVGEFTDASMGGEDVELGAESFKAQTARVNLGLTWWP